MLYLEIFIKICGIFKILILLPFFFKSSIWAAKCPKPLPIHWRVIEWGVFFKLLFLRCAWTPKFGCFFKVFKIQCFFCCFITQLVKKLQQRSLYKVIEDILPFVLNTKRPLSDIWLLSYKQNSFGCFLKKITFWIFPKTPKTVLLISQQLNIAQRPFCIQNERQDILYHLI